MKKNCFEGKYFPLLCDNPEIKKILGDIGLLEAINSKTQDLGMKIHLKEMYLMQLVFEIQDKCPHSGDPLTEGGSEGEKFNICPDCGRMKKIN